MFKKILLGGLLVGLIGVLIAGAVIRTNARAADNATGTGAQRGRAVEVAQAAAPDNGQRGGRWAQPESAVPQTGTTGGRGYGQGRNQQFQNALPAPQADITDADWMTLTGKVISATSDLIEIETAAGEVIPFEGQPLYYALGQGFSAQPDDAVIVSGFEEDGEFKIGQVTNLSNGASVTLRDSSGRPGWAGRGRRR